MRRSTATTVLLTAALLATTLSGCTVAIVDPGASDTSATPAPRPTHSSAEAERAEPAPSSAPPHAADGLSAEGRAERERLTAAASTTATCPTGAVTADGAIIRIEGACAELDVQADAAVVIADDVQSLTLSGSGTIVYVVNVDTVTVTGDASSIFWAGETPSVNDTGAANTLRRG